MTNVLLFPKTDMPSEEPIKALLLCPQCKLEMCLLGIEAESDKRDLYTFECSACGGLKQRRSTEGGPDNNFGQRMNERQNADLALAAWHVAQGRIIVARQRERIARLRALGCTTLDHEQTLNVFVSTLKIFIDHEQALREGIHVTKKSDGSPRAQACETDRGEYREVAGSD